MILEETDFILAVALDAAEDGMIFFAASEAIDFCDFHVRVFIGI